MNRYFVDKRVGCVAVRDRSRMDPDNHGLDTKDVVRFWEGIGATKICPECGHEFFVKWKISDAAVAEANALCDELNAKEQA